MALLLVLLRGLQTRKPVRRAAWQLLQELAQDAAAAAGSRVEVAWRTPTGQPGRCSLQLQPGAVVAGLRPLSASLVGQHGPPVADTLPVVCSVDVVSRRA